MYIHVHSFAIAVVCSAVAISLSSLSVLYNYSGGHFALTLYILSHKEKQKFKTRAQGHGLNGTPAKVYMHTCFPHVCMSIGVLQFEAFSLVHVGYTHWGHKHRHKPHWTDSSKWRRLLAGVGVVAWGQSTQRGQSWLLPLIGQLGTYFLKKKFTVYQKTI